MATNQGNPEVENSGNLGSDTMVVEVLKQLVQENQALSAKVEAMEVQVNEMRKILLTLRNGGTNVNATTVDTEVQVIRPPILAGPEISPHVYMPGINCQNYQAAQTLKPVIMPPQFQNPNPKTFPQALHFFTQTRKSHKTPEYPKHKQFDPIPMSYSDLFNHLLSNNLISPRPTKPRQPPFPKSFDPNATCKFHAGIVGHSIENCKTLKHVIQDLIDCKQLDFNDINASGFPVKKSEEVKPPQCDPIPVSHAELCSHLVNRNLVSPRDMKPVQPLGRNQKGTCELHAGANGHSAANSVPLKHLIQGFIDAKQSAFKEDGEGSMSNLDPQSSRVIRSD